MSGMSQPIVNDVYLAGVGAYVPDNFYTNEELCEAHGVPVEKGRKYEAMLGVRKRPLCVDLRQGGRQIVAGEELALHAARSAMSRAGIEAAQLDAVISCSSFFDY